MARRRLGFWGRFAVALVKPATVVFNKPEWRGWEHFPRGACIVVVNHISDADPFVIARYIYESGRWPRFLGKESLFKLPAVGRILFWCRQIPVRRYSIDAAKALDHAVEALEQQGTVVIYPEGTITQEPGLWPMRGKTGAARLHLLTGAPIIPVAMWGPEKIYDRRTKKLRLKPRTPVAVWAGPAVDLSAWAGAEPSMATLTEMTDVIMLRIRDLLAEIREETPPPIWTPAAGKGSAE